MSTAGKSVRTVKSNSSIGGGRPPVSNVGGAAGVTAGPGAVQKAAVVYPPSLPSNLQRDSDQDVVFNSIGFYSDLLARLDN